MPFQPPERWNSFYQNLQQTNTGDLSFQQLERMASRIIRCRQIQRTIEQTERQWADWQSS